MVGRASAGGRQDLWSPTGREPQAIMSGWQSSGDQIAPDARRQGGARMHQNALSAGDRSLAVTRSAPRP